MHSFTQSSIFWQRWERDSCSGFHRPRLSSIAADRWHWRRKAVCGWLRGRRWLPNEPMWGGEGEKKKKSFLSGSNRQAQFNSSVLDYLELSVTQVKGEQTKTCSQAPVDPRGTVWQHKYTLQLKSRIGNEKGCGAQCSLHNVAAKLIHNWEVLVQFIAQKALTKCSWMLLHC